MKKIALILGTVLIFLSGCDKDLPDPGGTASQKIANEWWTTLTVNKVDVYGIGHFQLLTYNTASNSSEIWIDDYGHSWQFKVKAQANYGDLTFSAAQATDQYNNIKVDITEGKVIPGAGRSKTGNVTDSIFMKIKFSDDPTTTYEVSGHARTKFVEDEY